MDSILIVIDREVFNKYKHEYFTRHPKAKIFPFTTKGKVKKTLYSVLSLNDILPINSMKYKTLKKHWGDFGVWLAKENKLNDKMFENAMVEIKIYSETKSKKDVDNIAGGYKLFSDGFFVQSNMFVDDNYNHINPMIISCHYDKENPRTEIRISIFDKTVDVYEKILKHTNTWAGLATTLVDVYNKDKKRKGRK